MGHSDLSIWHVHDDYPFNAVTCQFDQMGVMCEEDCLSVRSDFGAKLQGSPSAGVVKGLHDIVEDHWQRPRIAGKAAVSSEPQSKIQLAHRARRHLFNRNRATIRLDTDELIAFGLAPDINAGPGGGGHGYKGLFDVSQHAAAPFRRKPT